MEMKTEINEMSLDRLLSISTITDKGSLYDNKCFVYSADNSADGEIFKCPTRMNAYVVLVCSEGYVSFTCNQKRYIITRNMIFICTPGMILQLDAMEDYRFSVIIFEQSFLDQLNIDIRKISFKYQQIKENSCISLAEEDCISLCNLLAIAGKEIKKDVCNSYYHETVKSVIQVCAYKILYMMAQYTTEKTTSRKDSKRDDVHFREFIQLLSEHYKSQRSVMFYASLMCISPKYLSALIKNISGKTVSKWIDEYVVLEAKNLLKYSNMSIQEVAYSLNFANQSFFGKYFKKHTGLSPNAYRTLK